MPLEGKPESAQADSKAGKVYVNMEDLNAIKVIDTATHKVTDDLADRAGRGGDRHGVRRGEPSAVHRLRQQADAHGGQHERQDRSTACRSARASIPRGSTLPRKLAFTSNGESGTVTIAHEESPTLLKVVQTLKTRPGARTMALDPTTHTIYLAATDYEPQPAGSKTRPKPVVGTFRVLVYTMK